MRFRINEASLSLGGKLILDHCNLEIRGKEKIAIIGANGSGKTTLLRLIAGKMDLDADDKRFESGIWMARNTSIGMLEQTPFLQKEQTVEEMVERICPFSDPFSREKYEFEMEYHRHFTRFGFDLEQRKKKIGEFSGGEQTKIALIRLLLMKPDILLLDEPTNHLDIDSIKWLEEYIRNYEKAVVLVSHDRFFLDQVVDVVYELHQGKCKKFVGNYSQYRMEREKQLASLRKKYQQQQEEIQRLNELIERFKHKPKKAAMARSKKKVLERMEKIELPEHYESYVYPAEIIPGKYSAKWIYDCKKLVIGYNQPLHEINLRIKRGQKLAIIGANGIGKSTFLKTLYGLIPSLKGTIVEGNNVDCVYYGQHTADLKEEKRLLEDFKDSFPAYSHEDCRKILARFLFGKESLSKTISSLSGGEKSRYVFAKLMENKANVLLLDEPTNHLDIPTKEILESAFDKYQGSILFITHDRYFLQQLADSLLIFEKDKVTYFPYGYDRYLEQQEKAKERVLQGIHTMEEENDKLWRSFEAVPEKKRMQSARFNTEQSYTDWQLQLISEELDKVCHAYELLWEEIPINDLEQFSIYHDFYDVNEEEMKDFHVRLEKLNQEYEEISLRWYEKWQEYEEAFIDYHDA